MATDNSSLRDLVAMLLTVHRELQRKVVVDPPAVDAVAQSHHLNRRLIAQQKLKTTEDVRLILMAAEMAQLVDPGFSENDQGSALDLLRIAVGAIERLQSENRDSANEMLSLVLKSRS